MPFAMIAQIKSNVKSGLILEQKERKGVGLEVNRSGMDLHLTLACTCYHSILSGPGV